MTIHHGKTDSTDDTADAMTCGMLPKTSELEVGSAGAGVSGAFCSCGTAGSNETSVASGSGVAANDVAASGGRGAVNGGTISDASVADGRAGVANNCERGTTDGTKPTTPDPIAIISDDDCVGIAKGNSDEVSTNGMPGKGTLRREAELAVTAVTRGSNAGPLMRPVPNNADGVRVGVGLLSGNRPGTMKLGGTARDSGGDDPNNAVGARTPLADTLEVGAGRLGVGSCDDGMIAKSGEGVARLIGASWPMRFGDSSDGWSVDTDATVGATADGRVCADESTGVGEAGAGNAI